MTMDDLVAKLKQMTVSVSLQENPNCELFSLDDDALDAFQGYVNDSLAFAVKRGGFMYGSVSEDAKVTVEFIYEPPQQGTEKNLALLRDSNEERLVEAIAMGLGMRRVGFIFTQTVSEKEDYALSNREVLQAVELQAESGLREWVTALVMLEVSEESGVGELCLEAFQMSDACVRLFNEGWFEAEIGEGDDPKLSRMKKEVVVVGVEDATREVDNDLFLVPVKICDHQLHSSPLSSAFPIENRDTPVGLSALAIQLLGATYLPFVKLISDFHLLLLLSRYLDISVDVPVLAECIRTQTEVPERYKILIELLAWA